MTRQRVKPGDILRINIDGLAHTYARVLTEASVAFYDFRTTEEVKDIKSIVTSPILFIISVDRDAVTSGVWPKQGSLPLEENLKRNPPKYMKAIGSANRFQIYDNGQIRPATREECIGLELMASWSREHVEERLRCHYEGTSSWLMETHGPLR